VVKVETGEFAELCRNCLLDVVWLAAQLKMGKILQNQAPTRNTSSSSTHTNCYACCKMFLVPRHFAVGRVLFPAGVSGFVCAFAVIVKHELSLT
jgi:hypothetical protein